MPTIVETAYAKINLTLRVRGRRPDGMHELASIVAFADVGDRLSFAPLATASGPAALCVTGPFAAAIVGENLVARAVAAIERVTGMNLPAGVMLEKMLPVASGIGGGSADAAAALRGMRRLLGPRGTAIDWQGTARGLGADVPVCLESRAAMMTGIGDRLQPLSLPALDIVLANACEPVPADKTRRVFLALGAGPVGDASRIVHPSSLDRSALVEAIRATGNDLETPARAVLPSIGTLKEAVASTAGCEAAILSGAGPTVVGIYRTAEDARSAADVLTRAEPRWWVTASRTRAS
jgi:4-diphosphocytidyl-2-C-methyl-D-erythritol kinase